MSSMLIACIIFACILAGALLGMLVRSALPQHHLNAESKDAVRLGMGLTATMTALVLGLVIASAKESFDYQSSDVKEIAVDVIHLDRVLARYGPETGPIRDQLRQELARHIAERWPENELAAADAVKSRAPTPTDAVEVAVRALAPANDGQRWLQARAQSLCEDLTRTRWLLFEHAGDSIQTPFLVVLICWLTLLFASFGLFAPRNATVIVTLAVCALSVSGAIFLILEMDQPFEGLLKISDAPLRTALSQLGL